MAFALQSTFARFVASGPLRVKAGELRPYLRQYLRMVRTQLLVLSGGVANITCPVLREIVAKDDSVCDWADLFAIEDALIAALPEAQVYEAVLTWRARYRQVVGSACYREYEKTKPPDPGAPRSLELANEIRADMLALASRIHYAYAFAPSKEKMRNRLAILNAALILAGAFATIFGRNACPGWSCLQYSALEVTLLTGLLGGFVSVQQRLQRWSDVDPLFKRLEISSGWFSITAIAPITGGIFAATLYMIFVAGTVSGGAFPEFAAGGFVAGAGDTHGITFYQFAAWSQPKVPIDWAKLIVWSFVAGFAERFVPDVLTRLAGVQYSLAGNALKS